MYHRIEISNIVKRALLDSFSGRLARQVAAMAPKCPGGALIASDEVVVLAVTHKHTVEFCDQWVLAEKDGLDLLNKCVLRLFRSVAKHGAAGKEAQTALELAWAAAMRTACRALAAASVAKQPIQPHIGAGAR